MKQDRIADQDLIVFDPVPRRDTVGGWTAARQRAFITALAATGSVARAAAAVKMSKAGVYALRAAEGSDDFVRAWNAAVENGVAAIKSVAFERAVDGVEEDVWYHGQKCGTRTRYDNRLLATLLRLYAKPRAGFSNPQDSQPAMSRADIIDRLRTMSRRIAREDAEADAADATASAAERRAAEPLLPFENDDGSEHDDLTVVGDPLDWENFAASSPESETQQRHDIAAPALRVTRL